MKIALIVIGKTDAGYFVEAINEYKNRLVQFSTYIERKTHTVPKRLVFVVGGPYGFSDAVYKAAAEKISLSKMTFSHQMIRLIFIEQLYRAMTILNNEPYHHE